MTIRPILHAITLCPLQNEDIAFIEAPFAHLFITIQLEKTKYNKNTIGWVFKRLAQLGKGYSVQELSKELACLRRLWS